MVRAARFFLATLLMGMLMLVVNIAPVSAGGGGSPTLTADHNPVIVPFGQTTGTVTLTWDAGKGSSVEFYDSINGGPEIGPFIQPVVGTDTDTLTVGQTVTYRMYSAGKTLLLNTLTVTVRHPGANPPLAEECSSDFCITNVLVEQGFDADGRGYLDLFWTTSHEAGAIVAVSMKPAISDVDGNEFAHVDGAALQIARTGPKHSAHIGNLVFSKYSFVIEAIDANGKTVKHYGEYAFHAYL